MAEFQQVAFSDATDPAVGDVDEREQLIVDMDGFEGPLDLLLALARTRKLDLTHLSMLELARQYLRFIEHAEGLRLELAADYLVMAAWIAYLKSRLLLPREMAPGDEPSGEELAVALAFRLKRLEAMRQAGQSLLQRAQLGLDVFGRGAPEPVDVQITFRLTADIRDLVAAYAARQRARARPAVLVMPQRQVWSIKEARDRLTAWLGVTGDWSALDQHLRRWFRDPPMRRTVLASSLGAVLELAREGRIDLRQNTPYGPIFVRPKSVDESREEADRDA